MIKICNFAKKTGHYLAWPIKKYFEMSARNFEIMYGKDFKNIKFYM